jgi:hypothetical protein
MKETTKSFKEQPEVKVNALEDLVWVGEFQFGIVPIDEVQALQKAKATYANHFQAWMSISSPMAM